MFSRDGQRAREVGVEVALGAAAGEEEPPGVGLAPVPEAARGAVARVFGEGALCLLAYGGKTAVALSLAYASTSVSPCATNSPGTRSPSELSPSPSATLPRSQVS